MPLFHRIFDFDPATVSPGDQRHSVRYRPGAAFPLTAVFSQGGQDWPAQVQNISGVGLGLTLADRHADVTAYQLGRVRLTLGTHVQEFRARVIHLLPRDQGLYCGLELEFDDFPAQKNYLQLVLPVAIGGSLELVADADVEQDTPGFVKQVFRGVADAALTVWRKGAVTAPVERFEFQADDYLCRGDAGTGRLETSRTEVSGDPSAKPQRSSVSASGLQDEIAQLFRWIVPNLSPAVPGDVRAVLQRVAG